MSLTEPPPQEESRVDRPPSRRFTILFTLVMIVIAIGYTWVWQAKTSRVVAEPPPAFILGDITSSASGRDRIDEAHLRDTVAAHLTGVAGLRLVTSADAVGQSAPGRPAPRVYGLAGAVDRAANGEYRLELRRTDAGTDSLLYIYRVRGSTLPEVVQRMTVQVAMSFGLPLPDYSADSAPGQSGDTAAGHSGDTAAGAAAGDTFR